MPTWYETMASDLDRIAVFYADVFGWRAEAADAGSRLLFRDGGPLASVRRAHPADSAPRWATHFAVDDVEGAVRRATGLGAVVASPLTAADDGLACGLRSPQGVPFHLLQRGA